MTLELFKKYWRKDGYIHFPRRFWKQILKEHGVAEYPGALYSQGSILNPNWGPAIASAATIAPTFFAHHVTGTTSTGTITPPFTGFMGALWFQADGVWLWGAAGNIYAAGTVTTAASGVLFCYDGTKWSPSRLA